MVGVVLCVMLWFGALICSIGAIVHRKPDKSFWEIYSRCGLYQPGDLSPSGWQLHVASWILGVSCLLVAMASMYLM